MVALFSALLTLLGFTAGGGGNGGGTTGGPPKRPRRGNGATPVVVPDAPAVAPAARFHADKLAFPIPLTAGMSVRILLLAAGRPAQMDGLGGKGKTVVDARAALGRDLSAFIDLCLANGAPVPSQAVATERANDGVYRARLKRAMLADLDVWERALLQSKRLRDEALEAGLPVPPPFIIPPPVREAIEARNRAREAERAAVKGGRAAATGGGAPPPTAVQGSKHKPPGGPQR